ncbi:hypothetical protein ABZ793_30855 [Micromonospora sp. NPDC047465]|uniref:hypothetical protein n=1 Tax=Micromonospora sp. NPDC047465 TaxID=3154813 RepID=UPI0033BFC84D
MVVLLTGLLAATGCTRPGDTRKSEAQPALSPTATTALRLDKPKRLLDRWPESVDRSLLETAQQNLGNLKKLLNGEPTSAISTAYVTWEGEYSPERGWHRPAGGSTILISAVSGTVSDPTASLDATFTNLTHLTTVAPTAPGPLGDEARCGTGQDKGAHIEACGWADNHTVALVTFIGFPAAQSRADDFRQIRSQLENPVR